MSYERQLVGIPSPERQDIYEKNADAVSSALVRALDLGKIGDTERPSWADTAETYICDTALAARALRKTIGPDLLIELYTAKFIPQTLPTRSSTRESIKHYNNAITALDTLLQMWPADDARRDVWVTNLCRGWIGLARYAAVRYAERNHPDVLTGSVPADILHDTLYNGFIDALIRIGIASHNGHQPLPAKIIQAAGGRQVRVVASTTLLGDIVRKRETKRRLEGTEFSDDVNPFTVRRNEVYLDRAAMFETHRHGVWRDLQDYALQTKNLTDAVRTIFNFTPYPDENTDAAI